ncbi:C40 family peptidase [Roseofilum casamattae]|uniref:NlpC/P60 family protein n=1 Tax=Roseofilum casamattae BLCC-M143 TaxID=3022442 RepID=A0ABT7BZZ6_9CYAN|nr:C40 family peptidase [Roseofilum casamattae]MDJ1184054.1 NlpC/P60 family protein [Roseofilum casamattae BLCC-M143]
MTLESLDTTLTYRCTDNLDLYSTSQCQELGTQAARDRKFRILATPEQNAIPVLLLEDDYSGWLSNTDLDKIEPTSDGYYPVSVSRIEIEERIDRAIAYTRNAMDGPQKYLWGGNLGPDYDCSGLIQTAFVSVGIWIPRDAYQQQYWTQPISLDELQPGDLIFFASKQRVDHVALYVGDGQYIHSSGTSTGRNGIAIDRLSTEGDAIGQYYYSIICGAGRIMSSYLSQGKPDVWPSRESLFIK